MALEQREGSGHGMAWVIENYGETELSGKNTENVPGWEVGDLMWTIQHQSKHASVFQSVCVRLAQCFQAHLDEYLIT